jgi:HK97 family phage prohead protease
MKYDFSGYATKNDVKCTDGRTIRKDAFKDCDGLKVPLVWQHCHNEPGNVLGHALLENRDDGVYMYGKFNDTETAKDCKILVEHGDITSLSIYANQLKQKVSDVIHGVIREVSLVLAGANPGATIDNLAIEHSDGSEETIESEAVISMKLGLSLTDLEHADKAAGNDTDEETVEDILGTLNEKQMKVVSAIVTHALEGSGGDSKVEHSDKGGNTMHQNLFETQGKVDKKRTTLTHDQFATILKEAMESKAGFKDTILAHAQEYGIENIDVLFPDAQALSKDPEWLQRETGWVTGVLNAIHHSPFSRVKSVFADMNIDTARAKGYIKATEKKETYFKLAKRITTPTTIYVKQKLDRDDIIDVVDFDTIAMVRYQLRTLLDEELAVAALVGDGRAPDDQYKINEENIRPIWTDEDLYSVKEVLSTKTDYAQMVEEIALSGKNYKGSGSPVLYTTNYHHMKMLWIKDSLGRRIYESDATLCAALGVSRIEEITALENKTRTTTDGKTRELMGIKINLRDYNFGADKGGQVATFDDFDIDFNQYKYLMETRCSGALTKAKSAQVFEFDVAAAG